MDNDKDHLGLGVLLPAYIYSYLIMVMATFIHNYMYSHKYIFNDKLIAPYYESYSHISIEGLLYTLLSPIVYFLFPLIGLFRVSLYPLWFVLLIYYIFKVTRIKNISLLVKNILLIIVFSIWNMIGLYIIKN